MEPTNNSYQPGTNSPMPDNQAGNDSMPQNTPVNLPPVDDVPSQAPPLTDDNSSAPTTPPSTAADAPIPPEAVNIAPPAAEDSDLIEQEWVDKAKAIVNSNSHDPHALNKEINKFKADYIKKRYNKEIKVITD